MAAYPYSVSFFFFNDTATTEIYTLSLHDALPISPPIRASCFRRRTRWARTATSRRSPGSSARRPRPATRRTRGPRTTPDRSEEHTSELQSLAYLVCRLLLEKKKNNYNKVIQTAPI